MREQITHKWNWNNGTDFANWMTRHVAYKVLSEFWCWYGDVVKTVSRFTDDEHELAANNDGDYLCVNEIQTQEVLHQFYDDVIEPQLIHELDAYLNSDY